MPSARASLFTTADLTQPDTQRDLPPQSVGLRAPAGTAGRADTRLQKKHPGKRGRMSDEERGTFVDTVMEIMDDLTATEIAIQAGTSTNGRAVREVIAEAKTALQQRAGFYVKAHALATIRAAGEGDAKPAQWALEHIADGETRVVEPVQKEVAPTAPVFNIGFALGGLPSAKPVITIPATAEPVRNFTDTVTPPTE